MRKLLAFLLLMSVLLFSAAACSSEFGRSGMSQPAVSQAQSSVQKHSGKVTIDDVFEKETDVTVVPATAVATTVPHETAAPDSVEPNQKAAAVDDEPQETPQSSGVRYILNTNTKRFHYPDCSSVGDIKEKNKREFNGTRDEAIAMGFVPCKRCEP